MLSKDFSDFDNIYNRLKNEINEIEKIVMENKIKINISICSNLELKIKKEIF